MPARGLLSLVLASLALAGCATFDAREYRTVVVDEAATATWRGLPLASGQIIVSEHASAGSLFLSLVAERFAPFIHAGVIVFDDGAPYVYEAFGSIRPGANPPTLGMGGGVRRVSLDSFLARDRIVAVYEPPADVDRERLIEFARARWNERTPFDGVFDSRDATRVYCVEFVARALEAAGGASYAAIPVNGNESIGVVLDWLRIRSGALLLAGTLVEGQRRVALLSRSRSERQIAAYFSRKSELHRRFTAGQRLGNLLSWRLQSLHYRPAVAAYLDPDIGADVDARELAVRMLGREVSRGDLAAAAGLSAPVPAAD